MASTERKENGRDKNLWRSLDLGGKIRQKKLKRKSREILSKLACDR